MKKSSNKGSDQWKKFLKRKWLKELWRRKKQKKRKKHNRKIYTGTAKTREKRREIGAKKPETIEVPIKIDLIKNYKETIEFICKIREIAFQKEKPIRLNFEHVKRVRPSGLLVLASEIYRCLRNSAAPGKISGTFPKDRNIEHVLHAMGFFKLLNVKSRLTKEPKTYPLDYIKFITGVGADGEKWEEFKRSLLGNSLVSELPLSHKLYGGLTEAMTNVVHHAYPSDIKSVFPVLKRTWWLVGNINMETKELMVAFFDQGVGIPTTFPKNNSKEFIGTIFDRIGLSGKNEGELIRAAMELGKSRSQKSHRGRGLSEMRPLIDECGKGSLKILSARGRYEYFSDGKETFETQGIDLGGTLIEWRLPLHSIFEITK